MNASPNRAPWAGGRAKGLGRRRRGGKVTNFPPWDCAPAAMGQGQPTEFPPFPHNGLDRLRLPERMGAFGYKAAVDGSTLGLASNAPSTPLFSSSRARLPEAELRLGSPGWACTSPPPLPVVSSLPPCTTSHPALGGGRLEGDKLHDALQERLSSPPSSPSSSPASVLPQICRFDATVCAGSTRWCLWPLEADPGPL